MSAVGTRRQSCAKLWVPRPTTSTGRKSIEFISSTHTKTVSASGPTKCRECGKTLLTWSSTKSTSNSIAAWNLPGTPAVALDAALCSTHSPSTPRINPIQMLSQWTLPPNRVPLRWVR